MPHPGGYPDLSLLDSPARLTNGLRLQWSGPSGYYQVYQATNLTRPVWQTIGLATNWACAATVTNLPRTAFFRISGPSANYAGAKVCITCHLPVCRVETNTFHATAFSDPLFKAAGGQTNANCFACHTLGYGAPTGFSSVSATPALEGVQCENCHGPAANHAASETTPALFPRIENAATLCGGCHSADVPTICLTNHPSTYAEWSGSAHGAVTPGALSALAVTNNLATCGACHSGSVRMALANGANPLLTVTNDYNLPVTCVVCHDPHQTNAAPAQLRNPLFSTNYFALVASNTATAAAFTNCLVASSNVNLCAQCHNSRGASWSDTAAAPHGSLQYNYLLGSVGQLPGGPSGFYPSVHSGLPATAAFSLSGRFYLTNQCVACHMPASGITGTPTHTLMLTNATCLNCHDGNTYRSIMSSYVSNQVAYVVYLLNRWSATKAPANLRSNGLVAWEYTTPGGLSWTTNGSGYVTAWDTSLPVKWFGPNAAGQAWLTTNYPTILKARFDLYLILKDGSLGAHNPDYTMQLLIAAEGFLSQALQ